jgi:hypothetical protein
MVIGKHPRTVLASQSPLKTCSSSIGGYRQMITEQFAAKQIKAALKLTRPNPDNIDAYEQSGLLPSDFGSAHPDWAAWLHEHGGPMHTGVTLQGYEVGNLRQALKELTFGLGRCGRANNTPVAGFLPPRSRSILTKVGIRPSDVGLNVIPDSWS